MACINSINFSSKTSSTENKIQSMELCELHSKVGHHTIKGSKPYNEDASFSEVLYKPENAHPDAPSHIAYAVVSDGHGANGEGLDCAESNIVVTKTYLRDLYTRIQDWDTVDWNVIGRELTTLCHETFREVCVKKPERIPGMEKRIIDVNGVVCNASNGTPIHAGATYSLTMVYTYKGEFITVAFQVGDSDIYVDGVQLPCNHSPTNPAEFQRLLTIPEDCRVQLKYDGRIKTPHGSHSFMPDIYLANGSFDPVYYDASNKKMPWRWNGYHPSCAKYHPSTYAVSPPNSPIYIHLALLHVIGDFYGHGCGLTTEPDIFIRRTATHPTIIMGSDGAFDTISGDAYPHIPENQWISDRQGNVLDLNSFSNVVSQIALQTRVESAVHTLYSLFSEKFGGIRVDDVSLCVIIP